MANSVRKGQSLASETVAEEKIRKAAEKNFKDAQLLLIIHEEISKRHLFDDAVKMTDFLVTCTAYLQPMELHKSMALKGNRSVGKDNIRRANLRMFPPEDYLILTNATVAALEDDISTVKIIAYSEINLNKRNDKGANADLVEIIKQLTEGGTCSLKKDVQTGYKTTRQSRQEQKTVLYSTAEASADDDELSTRFIVGSVDAPAGKIEKVNSETLKWFAGKRDTSTDVAWFTYGVSHLLKHSEVLIPFAEDLPKGFFDSSDPRSMRDCKRFLACVSAVAWLHQLQRRVDDEGRVVAELYDLLAAMIVAGDFFNHTYQGLGDQRLQRFIDAMNAYCDSQICSDAAQMNIFPRHAIQAKLGCSMGGIRALVNGCQEVSIIRFHHRDNSVLYYERCQKGVKRVLMGVKWQDVIKHFEGVKGVKLSENVLSTLLNLESVCKSSSKDSTPQEFDTLKMTPSQPKQTCRCSFDVLLPCSFDGCTANRCVIGNDGKPWCSKHHLPHCMGLTQEEDVLDGA